ncbi:MAG: DUF4142 domain-containing protein [Methyloceanibacter sp.]
MRPATKRAETRPSFGRGTCPRFGPHSEQRNEQSAVELFDGYAEEGNNASLKQFAANTLPTIKQHREQAEKLLQ